MATLDFGYSGRRRTMVESGFASYRYRETYSGSAVTAHATLTIDETTALFFMHNSNTYTHARDDLRSNDTQASAGGHSYAFVDAQVSWASGSVLGDPGTYNTVIDTNDWSASGSYQRDGVTVGVVQLDGPVIADTRGPDLVLRLSSGDDITLHTLINEPKTGVPPPDFVGDT